MDSDSDPGLLGLNRHKFVKVESVNQSQSQDSGADSAASVADSEANEANGEASTFRQRVANDNSVFGEAMDMNESDENLDRKNECILAGETDQRRLLSSQRENEAVAKGDGEKNGEEFAIR